MTAQSQLGRVEGTWVMAFDVPLHLALGWRIVDDPVGDSGPRGFLLMQAPISFTACMMMPEGLPAERAV
jgi:hypothetical protein